MLQIHPADAAVDHVDHVDLAFATPAGWLDLPYPQSSGGRIMLMLIGDDREGPLIALASTTPTDMEAPRGPAHGHESDNWRITLLGSSPMGNEAYGPGEFRFQVGGRKYGMDGYASGRDGGYHLVMFGDRRGFATQPVKQHLQPHFDERDTRVAGMLGIDVPDHYHDEGRGLATTIGVPDKAGKVNGTFADADGWPEVADGVRAAVGLFGHRDVGPVLLLLRGDPGARILPPHTADTEVMTMVVGACCTIGGTTYGRGDIRIQHPATTSPEVVAGPDGTWLYVLLADRSRAALDALSDAAGWSRSPSDLADELLGALV